MSASSSQTRFVRNTLSDYSGGKTRAQEDGTLLTRTKEHVEWLTELVAERVDPRNFSAFNGTLGVAAALFRLSRCNVLDSDFSTTPANMAGGTDLVNRENKSLSGRSLRYAERLLDSTTQRVQELDVQRERGHLHPVVPTMIMGEAGVYAVASIEHLRAGRMRDFSIHFSALTSQRMLDAVTSAAAEDEVLYGRAGYLSALSHVYRALRELQVVGSSTRGGAVGASDTGDIGVGGFSSGAGGGESIGGGLTRTRFEQRSATSGGGRVAPPAPTVTVGRESAQPGEPAGDLVAKQAATVLRDRASRVIEHLLASGRAGALEFPHTKSARDLRSPSLLWQWHGKRYLGAAHGASGILYVIMNAHRNGLISLSPVALNEVLETASWLILDVPLNDNGVFPPRPDSDNDQLTQWCHGWPGVILTAAELCRFAAPDDVRQAEWRSRASLGGDIVWEQGLLKKGLSLCHGVSGNGYAFLALYRATGEQKWLHRAEQFLAYSCSLYAGSSAETAVAGSSDAPYSLYTGVAGSLAFACDVFEPEQAEMPLFEIQIDGTRSGSLANAAGAGRMQPT